MAETKMPSTEEYNNLKQQFDALSQEKADLETLRDLINKLSPVTGIENLISHILTAVMDIVGSEKVIAYYRLDKQCISIDAYGKKNEFDCFDDPLVVESIEKLAIIEKPSGSKPLIKKSDKSSSAAITLLLPLIVGENVIGAVKIENITGNSKEIQWKLQPFINYVAVILNNEIKNSCELNATYQKLQETNAKLLEEINKYVKTEEQLQEKSDTLKTIFEAIQIGIVIINPETHKIVYANPFAVKMIRAPREKIIGAECHKFICPAEKGKCPVTDLGQNVDNSESILITADWEERPIIKTVSHINISGRKHLLETFIDITERKIAEEALRKSDEEWHRTFDSISDLIFIQDNDHVILRANKAFYDALKSRPEDIVGKKCFEVLHKANSPWPNCPFEKTKEDQKAHTEEVDDKNIGIPLLITTSPIFNDKGGLIGSVHIAKDITERKKSEEELAFKNALLTTQQETSIDGILVVDGKGKIISFNQRFVDMWGISSEIIESKSDERALQAVLKEVADPIPFLTKVRYLYEHHHDTSRDEILLNDGRTFDRYSAPMFGDKDKYYGRVWYFRDITDHKQAEEKLIELSLMDELTGLNNRRGFSILAAKQIKNADRYKHGLTLIYIDLDNMKWINDNLGHKEGDRALVDISNIFKKSFRSSDIIGRLGGDEFAGLVVDSRGTTSDMILARMQESINELNSQKTRTYTLSISFGAIRYDNENPCSLNELLERGDKAMYAHKQKKGVHRGEKN